MPIGDRLCRIFSNITRRQLKLFAFVCTALFIINVYVICSYFQLYSSQHTDELTPHEVEMELLKEIPDLIPKVNGKRPPKCTFPDALADSVYSRMKTEECRNKLEDIVCGMDPTGWPVHSIKHTCPKFESASFGIHRGCYVDSVKQRALSGFKFELKDVNTPEQCIQYCIRIGFQFAGESLNTLIKSLFLGVEYASECFCGNDKDMETAVLHTNASECNQYACPGNSSIWCGGFNAISVYNTGVLRKCNAGNQFKHYFFRENKAYSKIRRANGWDKPRRENLILTSIEWPKLSSDSSTSPFDLSSEAFLFRSRG
jgi:hypothetical protein